MDSVITPWQIGERSHCLSMLNSLDSQTLLIMDRGYAAFPLFAQLLARNIFFCCRMPMTWTVVRDFMKSGQSEAIVTFTPSAASKKEMLNNGIEAFPITVRLVRIELPNGQIEVLCTSVLSSFRLNIDDLNYIYAMRWGIEESYNAVKERMELERFSGKSINSIFQDFFANVVFFNLMRIFSLRSSSKAIEEKNNSRNLKNKLKLNTANAIRVIRNHWSSIVWSNDKLYELEEIIFEECLKDPTPIRPGRKFSRKKKKKKPKFSMTKKSL